MPLKVPKTLSSPSSPTGTNTATDGDRPASTVQVVIPIDPYPDTDEPYLQSFDLLLDNAYQAVFSLGRLANALRFSQFLYFYRNLGSDVGYPPEFSRAVTNCLCALNQVDILDDTQQEVIRLLLNSDSRIPYKAGSSDEIHDEFFWDSRWASSTGYEQSENAPFFRRKLSDKYAYSRNAGPPYGYCG